MGCQSESNLLLPETKGQLQNLGPPQTNRALSFCWETPVYKWQHIIPNSFLKSYDLKILMLKQLQAPRLNDDLWLRMSWWWEWHDNGVISYVFKHPNKSNAMKNRPRTHLQMIRWVKWINQTYVESKIATCLDRCAILVLMYIIWSKTHSNPTNQQTHALLILQMITVI